MTNKKLYKTVSLTIVILLSFSFSNAGITGNTGAANHGEIYSPGKNKFPFLKDSIVLNIGLNTFSSKATIPLHPSVLEFTNEYIEKNEGLFETLKQYNNQTLKVLDKIFRQNEMPAELKYIAIVESKLKSNAVSGCGAVGLWQFMPGTAKRFGLKITDISDDRKNIWKSTNAAARYLNKLYDIFGDWLLVVAAYNSGPAPVLNAIKKSGSRSFWKLQYFLPKESRIHVKKFIATHYYFEGKGSMVTMGKTETENYLKIQEAEKFSVKNTVEKEDTPVNHSSGSTSIAGLIAIQSDEKYLKLILKK